jgi:hypothetical protein
MKLVWSQRLFLALIAIASVYAAAHNLASTPALGRLGHDPVADWEERFVPVRERLPFVRGVIGYISDSDVPGAGFDAANDTGEYILTQYAIAPIIIVRGTDQEWNLANLSRETFELWQRLHGADFELVVHHGGIYLLRRTGN